MATEVRYTPEELAIGRALAHMLSGVESARAIHYKALRYRFYIGALQLALMAGITDREFTYRIIGFGKDVVEQFTADPESALGKNWDMKTLSHREETVCFNLRAVLHERERAFATAG